MKSGTLSGFHHSRRTGGKQPPSAVHAGMQAAVHPQALASFGAPW